MLAAPRMAHLHCRCGEDRVVHKTSCRSRNTRRKRQERTGGGSLQLATERVQSPPFSKRKLIDIRAQRPAGMLHRDKSTNRTIIQSAFALSLSLSRNCWKRESFQGCGQCSKKSQKTGRDVYCNLRPRNCPIRASGFDLGGLAVVNLAIRQMPSWNTHAVFFCVIVFVGKRDAVLLTVSHTSQQRTGVSLFITLILCWSGDHDTNYEVSTPFI